MMTTLTGCVQRGVISQSAQHTRAAGREETALEKLQAADTQNTIHSFHTFTEILTENSTSDADSGMTGSAASDYSSSDGKISRSGDIVPLQDGYMKSAGWLPEGITRQLSETEPDTRLEKAIIVYCGIARQNRRQIHYFYNYADLNGDGRDEILVLVTGLQGNQSGGTLLWLEKGPSYHLLQSFADIQAPVLITADIMGSGSRRGLLLLCGSSDTQQSSSEIPNNLALYVCGTDGTYSRKQDADPEAVLDAAGTTAVICNDLEPDYGVSLVH